MRRSSLKTKSVPWLLTHTPAPFQLKVPYVARLLTRHFQVFRFVVKHEDHASPADLNRTIHVVAWLIVCNSCIHTLRRRRRITQSNSKCRISHDLRLARFCQLSRFISFASRGDVAEVGCRQHQPRPISLVFHSQVDRSGKQRDQQFQASNCYRSRPNRAQEYNSITNHVEYRTGKLWNRLESFCSCVVLIAKKQI